MKSAIRDATYFIPSEDEWYKAAYHDASAGRQGTTSTTRPEPTRCPTTTSPRPTRAIRPTFGRTTTRPAIQYYPMTDVGDYTLSESPYGTFDQGGNVWEWNEAVIISSSRLRGGGWSNLSDSLLASSGSATARPTRTASLVFASQVSLSQVQRY